MFGNLSISHPSSERRNRRDGSSDAGFIVKLPRKRKLLRSAWEAALAAKSVLGKYASTEPYMEIVYQQLVFRDLRNLGIHDDFYPVGSAASYSLFYILLRSLMTLPVTSVLDIGAGQTSLLLDATKKALNLDLLYPANHKSDNYPSTQYSIIVI